MSEQQFASLIEPSLNHLKELKGALSKDPCTIVYYPPNESQLNPDVEFWSVRCIVMVSVGKKRGLHFLNVCQSIVKLIDYELDGVEIRAETSVFSYS